MLKEDRNADGTKGLSSGVNGNFFCNYSLKYTMEKTGKEGSHKNIWYGLGRQRIEIPKPVLKTQVLTDLWLSHLFICSLGYYPQAKGHYTYRKKGLPENFLFYCVDGTGWYKIGKKKYEVNPHEFFILPQHIEHSYGCSEENPWSIYWIHFGGTGLSSFNNLLVVEKNFEPTRIIASDDIAVHFSRIYKTLEGGFSTDNLVYANMYLVHFLNLFLYNTRHLDLDYHRKLDSIDSSILYMQDHIHETLTLNQLSSYFNYSTSRFSHLFKQKTGYAPIDYFIQLKMQKASQQLDFTEKSVKEIASDMGFDDPYYFSKRFRKIFGMSPSQYRSIKKD